LHDLSAYVDYLRREDSLDTVAKSLQKDDGAQVIRDKDGKITELICDPLSHKPVDIKIQSNGDISIDGHSAQDINDTNNTYRKAFAAERVNNDDELSPEAKKNVNALESALLDGDSKSVIAGIKSLHGQDQVAQEVVRRLDKDLIPTEVSWNGDGQGGGHVRIKDYGTGTGLTDTRISTDGQANSKYESLYDKSKPTSKNPEEVISGIGKRFGDNLGEDLTIARSLLDFGHYIDDKTSVSPEKLADGYKAWKKDH
jgi:hypothetical protein